MADTPGRLLCAHRLHEVTNIWCMQNIPRQSCECSEKLHKGHKHNDVRYLLFADFFSLFLYVIVSLESAHAIISFPHAPSSLCIWYDFCVCVCIWDDEWTGYLFSWLRRMLYEIICKLETLREHRPPWSRQIITPILPNVKMLSLGGERWRFSINTCTTIWLCYCY